MARHSTPKEHRCERCGKAYTSLMRLQHHRAAEHALRTSRDIRTPRDAPHTGRSVTSANGAREAP